MNCAHFCTVVSAPSGSFFQLLKDWICDGGGGGGMWQVVRIPAASVCGAACHSLSLCDLYGL
jgi:hypothetical protein